MEAMLEWPYFPYPRWTFCSDSRFSDPVREELYEESKRINGTSYPKCMFKLSEPCQQPRGRVHCHHIVPERLNGPSSKENGIVLCTFHHELADDGIITPDACLMLSKGQNPYVDLTEASLDDLLCILREQSEFSEHEGELQPEYEWRLICSAAIALQHYRRPDLPDWSRIFAWALSVMAGFCTSHMRGGLAEHGRYHPRDLIEKYAARSEYFNLGDTDVFLSLHNIHHCAVNRSIVLRPTSAKILMTRVQKQLSQYEKHHSRSLMNIDLRSYKSYATSNQVAVLAGAGSPSSVDLIRELKKGLTHLSKESAREVSTDCLLASLLLNEEKEADYFADRLLPQHCAGHTVAEAIRFRVLAAWALRKGKVHDEEAKALIKQSEDISKHKLYGHQLGMTLELKRLMETKPDQLRFSMGISGSNALLPAL